jgi:hypothetical protein
VGKHDGIGLRPDVRILMNDNVPLKSTVPDEAGTLTPERRRGEMARILAASILRLHARAALPAVPTEQVGLKSPEKSQPARLAVSPEIVLSVHSG